MYGECQYAVEARPHRLAEFLPNCPSTGSNRPHRRFVVYMTYPLRLFGAIRFPGRSSQSWRRGRGKSAGCTDVGTSPATEPADPSLVW